MFVFVFVFMFVLMFKWTHESLRSYVVAQPAGSTASGAGNGTAAPMFDSCRSLIGCGMVEGRCHGGTAQAWRHSHLAGGTAAAAKSKRKAPVPTLYKSRERNNPVNANRSRDFSVHGICPLLICTDNVPHTPPAVIGVGALILSL